MTDYSATTVQIEQAITVYDIHTNREIFKSVRNRSIKVNDFVSTHARNIPGKKYLPSCERAKVLKLNEATGTFQINDVVEGRLTVDRCLVYAIYREERNSDASDALTLSPNETTFIPKNK